MASYRTERARPTMLLVASCVLSLAAAIGINLDRPTYGRAANRNTARILRKELAGETTTALAEDENRSRNTSVLKTKDKHLTRARLGDKPVVAMEIEEIATDREITTVSETSCKIPTHGEFVSGYIFGARESLCSSEVDELHQGEACDTACPKWYKIPSPERVWCSCDSGTCSLQPVDTPVMVPYIRCEVSSFRVFTLIFLMVVIIVFICGACALTPSKRNQEERPSGLVLASTFLVGPTPAGSTILNVKSQDGFVVGGTVQIADAANSEINTIVAFGSLLLATPLVNGYNAGATVKMIVARSPFTIPAGKRPQHQALTDRQLAIYGRLQLAIAEGLEPKDDLFALCGVELYSRPDIHPVRKIFARLDSNHNLRLCRGEECKKFVKKLSETFGDATHPSLNLEVAQRRLEKLCDKDGRCEWEPVRRELWELQDLWTDADPLVLFKLRDDFRGKDSECLRSLPSQVCMELAEVLLRRQGVDKVTRTTYQKSLHWDAGTSVVTIHEWLGRFAPLYQKHVLDWRHSVPANKETLGLSGSIESFAPIREGTPVEFLCCGAEIFMAMLREIKNAKSEILMSWWEFVPEVPALRGKNGKAAWDDPEGTLLPILKQKAEEGVIIKILVWNAPFPMGWVFPVHRFDYIVDLLNGLHPKIEFMLHPVRWPQPYSNHQKFLVVDRKAAILGGMDWTAGRYETIEHPLFDPNHETHPGIDYIGEYPPSSYWSDPERRRETYTDRAHIPRRAWQDVSICVWGPAAEDCATNFVQRWNHSRDDATLLDEIFDDGKVDGTTALQVKDDTSGSIPSDVGSVAHGTMKAQIVRSVGPWSAGGSKIERSCYQAWISAINSAKHFMYIELQYVISSNADDSVLNQIGQAIMQRVEAAVTAGAKFRVYILVPQYQNVDAVSFYTRRTLLQGPSSLWTLTAKLLKGTDKKPSDYISVCRLHNAAKSPAGEWKHSTAYIHSKVIIVDDRVAVVGSANCNDRSMCGDRDSELGAILWDQDMVKGLMDGKEVLVGKAIRKFRMRLWTAWLGGQEIEDPVSDEGYHGVWRDTAAHNQSLLESVFPDVPSDKIRSHAQWGRAKRAGEAGTLNDPERLSRAPENGGLRGRLVEFPVNFLADDDESLNKLEYFAISIPAFKSQFL